MKKTRTLLAAAAAITGLVALPSPAQAVPPQAQTVEFDLPGTNHVGDQNGYCPFNVHVTAVTTQAFPDPDGPAVQHFTGFVSVTVTNTETQPEKSLKFNASGPQTITFLDVVGLQPFTLDAGGPNVLYTTKANSFDGVPQIAYTTGHVQLSVDENGLTTDYKLNGKSTDVCAALS